jgi:hypothetical protein
VSSFLAMSPSGVRGTDDPLTSHARRRTISSSPGTRRCSTGSLPRIEWRRYPHRGSHPSRSIPASIVLTGSHPALRPTTTCGSGRHTPMVSCYGTGLQRNCSSRRVSFRTGGSRHVRITDRPTHVIRPHRPEAQDVALSRLKHGFESRWGRTPALRSVVSSPTVLGEAQHRFAALAVPNPVGDATNLH